MIPKLQITFTLFLSSIIFGFGQQIPDTTYLPEITNARYKQGEGPLVSVDEGHFNFHTRDGRYQTFCRLLERDGYTTNGFKGPFEKEKLSDIRILVISNALHESDVYEWIVPNPSAFTKEEIEVLDSWVKEGGRLFLIADHMPIAGAATELADVFGFKFTNGFVFTQDSSRNAVFNRTNGRLLANELTNGASEEEFVNEVVSFTGQAFDIPNDAECILRLDEKFINLLPDTAWVFGKHTKTLPTEGWCQGAYKKYGKGKIVAFGEAAMFSAQLAGPNKVKMGMNNPAAKENYKLLLNIIHWLDSD